jgi:hypothetical protein
MSLSSPVASTLREQSGGHVGEQAGEQVDAVRGQDRLQVERHRREPVPAQGERPERDGRAVQVL